MFPLYDTARSRTFPLINLTLILANVLAFLYELQMGSGGLERFIFTWGLIPARFAGDPANTWNTIYTSMFLHGGWFHIFSNMMALWVFGRRVEDVCGPWRFLAFYLACGFMADIVAVVTRMHSNQPGIGASGAL